MTLEKSRHSSKISSTEESKSDRTSRRMSERNVRERFRSRSISTTASTASSVKTRTSGVKPQTRSRVATQKQLEVNPYNERSDEERFDSDEEGEINRIGEIPLEWYEEFEHTGYTADGQQLAKLNAEPGEIDKLLANFGDTSEPWRNVHDPKNSRIARLTDADVEIIQRLRKGVYPSATFRPEDYSVEFDLLCEHKSALLRKNTQQRGKYAMGASSQHEKRKVSRFAALLRSGKMRSRSQDPLHSSTVESLEDLWGPNVYAIVEQLFPKSMYPKNRLPAPRMPLPTHAESYNPPEEYLFAPDEKKEWEDAAPEDRKTNFMPQKFKSLRVVPVYQQNLYERYLRCLDLYSAPRAVKHRMNIDPDSLLPPLPDVSSFKPFPSQVRLDFCLPVSLMESKGLVGRACCVAVDSSGQYCAVGTTKGFLFIFSILTTRHVFVCNLFSELSSKKKKGEINALSIKIRRIDSIVFHPSLPILSLSVGYSTYVFDVALITCPSMHEDGIDQKSKHSRKTQQTDFAEKKKPKLTTLPEQTALLFNEIAKVKKQSTWHHISDLLENTDPEFSEQHTVLRNLSQAMQQSHILGLVLNCKARVTRIRWHRKGTSMLTVCSEASKIVNQCSIHLLTKGVSVCPISKSTTGAIRDAAFHPLKPWAVFCYHTAVKIFDLQTRQQTDSEHKSKTIGLVKKFKGAEDLSCLSVHPKGDQIIASGPSQKLVCYDVDAGQLPTKVIRLHEAPVSDIAFHRTYPLAFSVDTSGTVSIMYAHVGDAFQEPIFLPLNCLKASEHETTAIWHPKEPWLITGADTHGIIASLWS